MANNKARRARVSVARPSARALRALRRAGIKYSVSRRHGYVITGKTRPPRPLFPKARFRWLRRITY